MIDNTVLKDCKKETLTYPWHGYITEKRMTLFCILGK